MGKIAVEAEYCTDIGSVRASNQDNLYFNGFVLGRNSASASGKRKFRRFPMLFAICDGMGGETRGDEAAFVAAKLLASCQTALIRGIENAFTRYAIQANEAILRLGRAGSTLVALALKGDVATVAHLGDSRAYLYRDDNLNLLTEDHTQQRICGNSEDMEHGGILTRHLGMELPGLVIRPSYNTLLVRRGDIFLLCSDGLTATVKEAEIGAVLNQSKNPARALAAAAVQNGGMDNATVIVVKLL